MPAPLTNLFRAAITTLVYFDIFDFPLTEKELHYFLHTKEKVSPDQLQKILPTIPHDEGFYFLPKRNALIEKRIQRENTSEKKIQENWQILPKMAWIPTIVFLGISGSLAMKNGDEKSDIDIFLITLPHTVWITRVIVWTLLSFMGRQRKRNTTGENSICVNMIMDRNALLFSPERQDIYTAHELLQMRPIINKCSTYEVLLGENKWVKNLLANAWNEKPFKRNLPLFYVVFSFILAPFDVCFRLLQILYMRRHHTIEQTTPDFIAFHPHDYRATIRKEFQKKIEAYAI